MNRIHAGILALIVGVATGCATAGGGGTTQEGYTRPSDNSETRTASLFLARAVSAEAEEAAQLYQQALEASLAAIEADPENPKGYYLAGQASAGVGEFVAADTLFEKAEELYPPYEDEISIDREQAWIMAYNAGVTAVNEGDIERAGELFAVADRLYRGRPEALMNLAWVHLQNDDQAAAIEAYQQALMIMQSPARDSLSEEQLAAWQDSEQLATNNMTQLLARSGQYDRAAEVLSRYLEYNPEDLSSRITLAEMLGRAGNAAEAEAIYNELLSLEGLGFDQYFQIGIGFFNAEKYGQAADAFRDAAELNPYSRDAWYNLVQARYSEAQELENEKEGEGADVEAMNQELAAAYREIVDAADRVLEFDPYNRNILTFIARAYRGLADATGQESSQELADNVRDVLRRYEEAVIEIVEIRTMGSAENPPVQVNGTLQNIALDEGAPIRIEFTLLDTTGQSVGSTVIETTAPAADAQRAFSGTITPSAAFAGWRYELLD